MAHEISKDTRYKIWTMFYEGESERKIARDCYCSIDHVAKTIADFRRAERMTALAKKNRIVLDDEKNIQEYMNRHHHYSAPFVLITTNHEVINAYHRLVNP